MEGRDNLHDDGIEADPLATAEQPDEARSLADDLIALVDDARTYLDAELSYQKSRAGFVADRVKRTVAFGLAAVFFALFAVIGLTVGAILALTPLLTAWGATAVVVLALLLCAWLLVRKASASWTQMTAAMKDDGDETDLG